MNRMSRMRVKIMTHMIKCLKMRVTTFLIILFLIICPVPRTAAQGESATSALLSGGESATSALLSGGESATSALLFLSDAVTKQYYRWLEEREAAIPDLKNALKHEHWRMRTHALLAMGKTGDKRLIPIILETLKNDAQISVRNCAVIALAELEAKSAIPYLLTLLEAASKEKRVAQKPLIEAFGKIKDPRAAKPLYELLFSKRESLRRTVTNSLIAIQDPSVSRLLLKNLSKVKKHRLEKNAAEILGELPVSGAEEYLLSLPEHPDRISRIAGITALGKIRSQRASPLLLKSLETGEKEMLKHISEALIRIDSPDAVEPLCALLTKKIPLIAMTSADILSKLSAESIPERVYARFESDPSINELATYVLGRKKYEKALPLIRKRLKDPGQSGQDEMARALGWMGDRESVPLLISIAERKSRHGSAGAIWSLGQIKAREAVPVLLKLLDQRDPQLTPRIISALGNIRDRGTAGPLIRLYYETGRGYSLLIADALGNIGGPEVIEFVKDNIDSDDKDRKRAGGHALSQMRDKAFVPYFITLLDHKDRLIREYAMRALRKSTGLKYHTIDEWKKVGIGNRE